MAGSFSAQVSAWAAKSEARLTAVFRHSAQTVANEVRRPKGEGGHMPVLTGNLRRSLMASTSTMPTIQRDGREFGSNDGQITLTIAGAEIGQVIYLGFQAAYARVAEYREGNGFVRLTAQRWPEIVAESASIIRSRVDARS